MTIRQCFLLSFILSSLLALPALAQDPAVETLTYDNYADFNAAYPAVNVLTFEDHGPLDVFYGDTGYAEAGASITATDAYLFVRSNGTRNGFIYGGLCGGPNPSGTHVRIDLPPGTNAFGTHVTGFFVRSAGEMKVTLSTGQEFLVATTGLWYTNNLDPRDWDKPSFFGVISAEPFEWVTVEMSMTDYFFGTDYVVLDTVSYGYSDLLEPQPACGDGVVDAGEECDDGNVAGADGCSATCRVEPPPPACGDGVVNAGEECDDGNLADADGCSASCTVEVIETAYIGTQSKDQRKCIVAMNKYGSKLAREMNRSAYRCIKYFGRDKLHKLGPGRDAESCLTADVKGREARREDKLMDKEEDKCLEDPEDLPDFAYMGSEAVMAGAHAANWGLLSDFFGDPGSLNSAVVMKDVDRDGRSCQRKTYKYAGKLFYAKMKTFYECKRNTLKGKHRFTDPADFGNVDPDERVESMNELEAEILACVEADPRGRITRYQARLAHKLMGKCEFDEMRTPMHRIFPGACAEEASLVATDPGPFMNCLDQMTDCQFCRSMNAFDGFYLDCDDYDNGEADLSCM